MHRHGEPISGYQRQRIRKSLSRSVISDFFATPWTVAHQAPLSLGFSRQEYWSGLPCHPPGDLLNPGIKSMSLMSPALAARFFTASATWEAPKDTNYQIKVSLNHSHEGT